MSTTNTNRAKCPIHGNYYIFRFTATEMKNVCLACEEKRIVTDLRAGDKLNHDNCDTCGRMENCTIKSNGKCNWILKA